MTTEKTEVNKQDVLGQVPYRVGRETLTYVPNSDDMPLKKGWHTLLVYPKIFMLCFSLH